MLAGGVWLILAGLAAALKLGWLSPRALEGLRLCLFHRLTGHPCPGCGMGRSLLAAFQGDWAASWAHHPLGLPLLALWTFYLAWGLRNVVAGRGFSEAYPLRLTGLRGAAVLALVLGAYVLRLLA